MSVRKLWSRGAAGQHLEKQDCKTLNTDAPHWQRKFRNKGEAKVKCRAAREFLSKLPEPAQPESLAQLINPSRISQSLSGQNWHFFIDRQSFITFGYYTQKRKDVGNCEHNALKQESWQSVLVCSFGVKKTNKILVENAKINAKFVMHLLQSSKQSCEIYWVGQISIMHHHLVFFLCLA